MLAFTTDAFSSILRDNATKKAAGSPDERSEIREWH
jgi:hypothetical protein